MKVVKVILIGLAALVGLVLITALFVKKDYQVERSIAVNRPKAEVFDYIKNLKNQDQYSVWAKGDPAMKKEYRGTDGTVGFVSAWESKKMGKGEQEIKGIREGERVDYELRFKEPMAGTNQAYMTTEAVSEGQTSVKWGFSGHMSYPMNVMILFMEGSLGNDFQQGLTNLKSNLERQAIR